MRPTIPSPKLLGVALLAAFSPLQAQETSAPGSQQQPTPERRQNFDSGWRFILEDSPKADAKALSTAALNPWLLWNARAFSSQPTPKPEAPPSLGNVAFANTDFDDSKWRPLDLPHDWGIEGPFKMEYESATGKLPYWGTAWYRKAFDLPVADSGKRIHLDFDGAMSNASVWINGHWVGGWPYGYASWRVDLTPHVHFGGRNVVAVRLNNPDKSSRWYPGGGIYRSVWLEKIALIHIDQWGVQVTTPEISPGRAAVQVKTTIRNTSDKPVEVTVRQTVRREGETEALATFEDKLPVAADSTSVSESRGGIANPVLWDIDDPNLYVLETKLLIDNKENDRLETRFGVRTFEFTAKDGFHLNGRRVPLQGVCLHHDLGALGTAFNVRAAERQLEIMKEMGVNAIRTSHNPPDPRQLDLCDRMGLLVMVESFDCWAERKKPNDYGKLFEDWSERDLRALVRRDRNHPSVVLWCNGNESLELKNPALASEISHRLTNIFHEEDPTRPVTAGSNKPDVYSSDFAKTLDVIGLNYYLGSIPKIRMANPDKPLIGSETSSAVSSRGEYMFPVSDDLSEGRSHFQVSSYDLYAPYWGRPPDAVFTALDKTPEAGGEFVWTGFDYIGEPTPYNRDLTNLLNFNTEQARKAAEEELAKLGKIKPPSRSSYFGIVDLAGFKKDRFYLYQARWRPDLPMAHILPHWTWPERVGQVTPVHVHTSGDEAELFLNGKSLGRKKKGAFEYRLRWDNVVYAPGELKVQAYKEGKPWADAVMQTAGEPARLDIQADREEITGDGRDLAFVTVRVVDAEGRLVPQANLPVRFEVEGAGRLVATDNGDPTDLTIFSSPERKAFNGLALGIVAGTSIQPGTIRITAKANGLQPALIDIKSKK